MNYKISLAALAVAATVSGQAVAALSTAENAALAALITGPTGVSGGWTTSIDGSTALSNTANWTAGAADSECTWRGIVCDGGATGNITHVEIPNTGLTDMTATLAALAPAAATITVINLSNGAGAGHSTPNALPGSMAGLSAFTALTHLAVNNNSAAGVVPDMSASSNLNWVNFADNAGITGMGAKLAGGSAITYLQVNNSSSMTGDLTATFDNITHPVNVTAHNSKVSGTLNWVTGDTVSVQTLADGGLVSDIVVVGGTNADHGYDASLVVQPVASVTLNSAGEETATFSWIAPTTTGAETGASVSYTADDGVTLQGTTAGAANSHTFTGMTAGTYKAVVQSTGPNSRMSAPVLSDSFVVTAATAPLNCTAPQVPNTAGTACVDPAPVTPPTCVAPQVLNTAQTECVDPTPVSSGGGGAAFWLIMLPLMGLFRRKSA